LDRLPFFLAGKKIKLRLFGNKIKIKLIKINILSIFLIFKKID